MQKFHPLKFVLTALTLLGLLHSIDSTQQMRQNNGRDSAADFLAFLLCFCSVTRSSSPLMSSACCFNNYPHYCWLPVSVVSSTVTSQTFRRMTVNLLLTSVSDHCILLTHEHLPLLHCKSDTVCYLNYKNQACHMDSSDVQLRHCHLVCEAQCDLC